MPHAVRLQRTIGKPVKLEGFGYWSGRDVRMEFKPASVGSGIVFVRHDLQGLHSIPAIVSNRIETPRRTTLEVGTVVVEMVEHVMAALAGMQVDNCAIWVDSPEMPGFDGSSLAFVQAIEKAGIVEQDALRAQLIINDTMRVGDENAWVEASPTLRSGLSLKYRLDYGRESPIGRQKFSVDVTPDSFREDLAPARTFILKEEADWLRERGLGTRVTYRDLLVFDDLGPIENTLRFENECVRHKTLDLVGDFALTGCDIIGQIVAYRSGHRLNAELAKALMSEGQVLEHWRKTA